MNVLIPMAGAGSRFQKAGYVFPKPLIEVNGKPMIQVVVENLNIDAKHIFIVQRSHYEKYNLKHLLNLIVYIFYNHLFYSMVIDVPHFRFVMRTLKNTSVQFWLP